MQLEITDWGQTTYRDAFERQLECVALCIAGQKPNQLIFTEHAPVYTVGKRPETVNHFLWDEATIKKAGIEVEKTNRGGDITYHGPGQIVGYSIINLHKRKDLHQYLRKLEDVLIKTLKAFELEGTRRSGKTGVWIQNRKIAAIGVAVKQWVTYHGFALNVNTQMEHFRGIVPCGIRPEEGVVTSLAQELGAKLDLDEVKAIISDNFLHIFADYE